jgi:hypothetical protein
MARGVAMKKNVSAQGPMSHGLCRLFVVPRGAFGELDIGSSIDTGGGSVRLRRNGGGVSQGVPPWSRIDPFARLPPTRYIPLIVPPRPSQPGIVPKNAEKIQPFGGGMDNFMKLPNVTESEPEPAG